MLPCTCPTKLWCPPSVAWCSVRERLIGSSRSFLRKLASFKTLGTWYEWGEKTTLRLTREYRHLLDSSLTAFGTWRFNVFLFFFYLSVYVCIFRPLKKEIQWPCWRNNWTKGRDNWWPNKRIHLQQRTVWESSPRLANTTVTFTACSHGSHMATG